MITRFYKKFFESKFRYFLFFGTFVLILYAAIHLRLGHTYLEDDLIWLLPLISHLLEKNMPLGNLLGSFHLNELTLFDGSYFTVMLKAFGFNFKAYLQLLFVFHIFNAILFYVLLYKRIKLKFETSFFAAFIYLTYYGHFHAYLWPVSAHHLLCVSAIFLILIFYLKTQELAEEGRPWKQYYALTLGLCVAAAFLRLSIVILPVILAGHILYYDKSLKNVARRYLLWTPAFVILCFYQLIVLAMGESHGNMLKKFLQPWQDFLGQKDFKTVLIVLTCLLGITFAFWGLLMAIEKLSLQKRFAALLEKCNYILLFFPHLFLVALFAWLNSYGAAVTSDPLLRWHPMLTPKPVFLYWIFVAGVIGIYFYFIKYAREKNRHLIIFMIWYICLQPYLLATSEGALSRYLVYYSAFLSCVLSLIIFEWLPEHFRLFRDPRAKIYSIVIIVFLAGINILAIHLRLQRSFFGDHYWSYDYIKYANLIKEDIKNNPSLKGYKNICIENIEPVAYWQAWQRSFLGGTDIDPSASFLITAKSVLGNKILLRANNCQEGDLIYTATDKTLIRNHSVLAEDFYHHLSLGLLSLKQEDYPNASFHLQKSVDIKPYVLRLFSQLSYFDQLLSSDGVIEAARVLRRFYYLYYADEAKSLFIENMIQNEMLDYGASLILLSYAQNQLGEEAQARSTLALAKRIFSQQDLITFPYQDYMNNEQVEKLFPLILALDEAIVPTGVPRAVKLEPYGDFDLYWFPGKYFAVARTVKNFDIAVLKRGVYDPHYVASRRHQLKTMIDESSQESENQEKQNENSYAEEYKGFVIKRKGAGFLVRRLIESDTSGFECLSVTEAKIIIDEYFKL